MTQIERNGQTLIAQGKGLIGTSSSFSYGEKKCAGLNGSQLGEKKKSGPEKTQKQAPPHEGGKTDVRGCGP